MKEFRVKSSIKPYSVYLSENIFCDNEDSETGFAFGEVLIDCFGEKKALLIVDENVSDSLLKKVKNALNRANSQVFTFTFASGEKNKSINCVSEIISCAVEYEFTRKDCFFAIGGGVVSDTVGFAASVYMRGINYYALPTTFLSAIDASIGGKTAVDLPFGKNLVGTFYNPSAVFCDVAVVKELPFSIIKNASSEWVKYALISGGKMWNDLTELLNYPSVFKDKRSFFEHVNFCDLIEDCLKVKIKYVEVDEFDKGQRMILNYGHTVGHAVETLSSYELTHGECVAMGICAELKASVNAGITPPEILDVVEILFKLLDIQTDIPYTMKRLLDVIIRDKKKSRDLITLPVITAPGFPCFTCQTISELEAYLCR